MQCGQTPCLQIIFPPSCELTNYRRDWAKFIGAELVTVSRIFKKLTQKPSSMSLFSCSPLWTKVKGENQLEEGYKKVIKDFTLRVVQLISLKYIISRLYMIKRILFSKHLCINFLKILQGHQLHFMISKETDVSNDCKI